MRVHTTDTHHPYPVYPNLVTGRTPDAPDVIWVADLTSIRLLSEFVYLATILDAYSRKCVGWNLSTCAGYLSYPPAQSGL
jgi:putative transposase